MTNTSDILSRLEKLEASYTALNARLVTRSLEQLPDGIVTTATSGVSGGVKHINCDNNHLLLNYPTPTAPSHLTNKQYVDDNSGGGIGHEFVANLLLTGGGFNILFDSDSVSFSPFNFQLVYSYVNQCLFIENKLSSSDTINMQFNFNQSLNLSSFNTVPTDTITTPPGLPIQVGSAQNISLNGVASGATRLDKRDAVTSIDISLAILGDTITESATIRIDAYTTIAQVPLVPPDVLGLHIRGLFIPSTFSSDNKTDHIFKWS